VEELEAANKDAEVLEEHLGKKKLITLKMKFYLFRGRCYKHFWAHKS